MADRYWVGGTASWDSTAGTKWATTSGGAGGASVPTTSDNVFFDAASGAGTATVVGNALCLSINCTGFTGSIGAQAGTSPVLIVTGNITLSATMGTFGDSNGACRIFPSGTSTITTNGKQSSWSGTVSTYEGLTFDGSTGRIISLLDDLKVVRARLTGTVALLLNNFSLDLVGTGVSPFTIVCGPIGPQLNFGATGKIIVRNGGTQINFITSGGNTNVTFFGSKLVSVDILSPTILTQNTSTAFNGASNQALSYVSTATNQAQFNLYWAEDLDWSLGTGAIRLDRANNFVYGSWNSGTKAISKTPAGDCTINFQANSIATRTINATGTWNNITINISPTSAATYNLTSNIDQTLNQRSTFRWSSTGTAIFNTNNFNIQTSGFEAGGGTCNLGTSTITSYAFNFGFPTFYLWFFGSGVDASNATLRAAFNPGILTASNMTIGTLSIDASLAVTIAGSNATFNTITNTIITNLVGVRFPAGQTTTVNNLNLNGNVSNTVVIDSSTSGTRAILSKASGTVSLNYVRIKDSQATGGATWLALTSNGNVDLGNNIGWDFGVANATGVAATGQVGVLTVVTLQNETVNVTGVSATGNVGTVTVIAGTDINVSVVGVQATGEVGNVTVSTNVGVNVNLIGVSAIGQVGILFFYQWSTIIDTQDPNWVPVNDLQTPIWATINPNSSPVWTDVVI